VTGPELEGGASNVSTKTAVVQAAAPSKADFTASPTRGESPLTVRFTDRSAGNPTSWQWQFGDGTSGPGKSPSHVYRSPGKYTVSLKVSGPGGQATSTKSGLIVVSEPIRTVPNVVGKKLADAKRAITSAGLTVGKVEEISFPLVARMDKVAGQDPPPGRRLRAGSPVNLKHIS
jgi:PKD repeat protein